MAGNPRSGSGGVGPRVAFVAVVSIGACCWVGSLLSWVAFAFFMAVGGHSAGPLPVGCAPCLEEGIPPPGEWLGIAWVLGPTLAVGSGLARVCSAPRVSGALGWFALLSAALALAGMVGGAESARDFWVRSRFELGTPAAPIVGLIIQHQQTACAVVAAGTLAGVALFVGFVHRERVPAPLLVAGVTQLAACALAWDWMQRTSPEKHLSSLLQQRGELAPAIALVALVVTALASVVWVNRGEAPGRREWIGLLAWMTLGALLRVSTFTYDEDLRSPPPLRPLARGREPWPWVERCEDFGLATVIELREGDVVIHPEATLASPEDLENAITEDEARDGASAPRALGIAASGLDDDVSPLQPYLRAALEHGLRDAELVVQERPRYPSATYGTIRDRRSCAVRVPIARLLDARTYGAMLTRAGARASSRPPP